MLPKSRSYQILSTNLRSSHTIHFRHITRLRSIISPYRCCRSTHSRHHQKSPPRARPHFLPNLPRFCVRTNAFAPPRSSLHGVDSLIRFIALCYPASPLWGTPKKIPPRSIWTEPAPNAHFLGTPPPPPPSRPDNIRTYLGIMAASSPLTRLLTVLLAACLFGLPQAAGEDALITTATVTLSTCAVSKHLLTHPAILPPHTYTSTHTHARTRFHLLSAHPYVLPPSSPSLVYTIHPSHFQLPHSTLHPSTSTRTKPSPARALGCPWWISTRDSTPFHSWILQGTPGMPRG